LRTDFHDRYDKYKTATELELKVLKALSDRYRQETGRKPRPYSKDYSKDVSNRSTSRNSQAVDVLNSSVTSEYNHTRYSSQITTNLYDPKVRVRSSIRGRPDSLENTSMSGFDFSTRPNTGNLKTKVTFVDSSKHSTQGNEK